MRGGGGSCHLIGEKLECKQAASGEVFRVGV